MSTLRFTSVKQLAFAWIPDFWSETNDYNERILKLNEKPKDAVKICPQAYETYQKYARSVDEHHTLRKCLFITSDQSKQSPKLIIFNDVGEEEKGAIKAFLANHEKLVLQFFNDEAGFKGVNTLNILPNGLCGKDRTFHFDGIPEYDELRGLVINYPCSNTETGELENPLDTTLMGDLGYGGAMTLVKEPYLYHDLTGRLPAGDCIPMATREDVGDFRAACERNLERLDIIMNDYIRSKEFADFLNKLLTNTDLEEQRQMFYEYDYCLRGYISPIMKTLGLENINRNTVYDKVFSNLDLETFSALFNSEINTYERIFKELGCASRFLGASTDKAPEGYPDLPRDNGDTYDIRIGFDEFQRFVISVTCGGGLFGKLVAKHFADKGPLTTAKDVRNYLNAVKCVEEYAVLNRKLILYKILTYLYAHMYKKDLKQQYQLDFLWDKGINEMDETRFFRSQSLVCNDKGTNYKPTYRTCYFDCFFNSIKAINFLGKHMSVILRRHAVCTDNREVPMMTVGAGQNDYITYFGLPNSRSTYLADRRHSFPSDTGYGFKRDGETIRTSCYIGYICGDGSTYGTTQRLYANVFYPVVVAGIFNGEREGYVTIVHYGNSRKYLEHRDDRLYF